MQSMIEVIYFTGCPNAAPVVTELEKAGLKFTHVVQDRLGDGDARKNLSSPSVLIDGVQVVGGRGSGEGSMSCTWSGLSPTAVLAAVRTAILE